MKLKKQKFSKPGITVENDNKNWLDDIKLPENYKPTSNEEYMCDLHLKYFYLKLLEWKNLLIAESDNTLVQLQTKHMQEPDDNDRASSESETGLELRTRERYLKLISKIDKTITKILNKDFGYCDETGEEIGIARLEARPIASLTVAAQEEHERKKKLKKLNAKEENF